MTHSFDSEAIRQVAAGRSGEFRIICLSCQGGSDKEKCMCINADTGDYVCHRATCGIKGNFKHNTTEKKLKAAFIWEKSRIASEHPYPTRKQIHPPVIRVDMFGNWLNDYRDQHGKIRQIQMVNPEKVPGKSDKFFLSKEKNDGVGYTGAAYRIEGAPDTAYVCEGPATGWSIHEATGATVYCVGGCENFKHVVPWVMQKHKKVVVCADAGNGEAKARKVAQEHNLPFAVPGIPGTDFNDMAIDAGPEAVKKVLENAKVPGQTVDIEIPNGITAADLIKKDFPEPKWAVRDILPEGLNILGGKPKGGKSILSLNLCLAIAMGGKALQTVPVDQGTTIYLALEDVQRRLKTRLNQMLVYDPAPDNLLLFTEWPRLGSGGGKALDVLLAKNPDARLVVIDTLAKIRPPQKSNGNLYTEDYDIIDALKGIADKHTVSVLIVHHLRKMESSDPFDMFSGTLGLTGAADGLLVMKLNGTGQTVLSMRGRDVEERELLIELDPLIMTWKSLGEAAEVQATKERQRLFDCLKDADGPLSPKEIEGLTGLRDHYIRKTLPVLLKEGTILKKERGKYIFIGNNGHNGNSGNNGNIGNNSEIVPDTGPIVPGGYKAGNNCKSLTGKGSGAFVPDVPDVPDLCKSCEHFHSDSKSCLHSDFPVPVEVNQAILNCPGGGD